MELFLARVIGLYLLIVGLVAVFRKKSIMPAVSDLGNNRAILIALGAIELAAGLALVVAYPTVSLSLDGILSVLGYMLIIESIIYFAFPVKFVRKMISKFNRPHWYVGGGLVSAVIGAYMAAISFGLM